MVGTNWKLEFLHDSRKALYGHGKSSECVDDCGRLEKTHDTAPPRPTSERAQHARKIECHTKRNGRHNVAVARVGPALAGR